MSNVDWDLKQCIYHNDIGYGLEDIHKVLAVIEGSNDGPKWKWLVKLCDGRYALTIGGCDYTGWDCQSWASTYFAKSIGNLYRQAKANKEFLSDADIASLTSQYRTGRNKTKREIVGENL
jgi:hypothetical protein